MDPYRESHASRGCEGLKHLRGILEAGQPPVDVNEASIQELQDREKIVFYPADVKDILKKAVRDILYCRCDRCKVARGTTGTETDIRVEATLKHCTLLLAILIYLARPDLIHIFVRREVTDTTLLSVPTVLEDKEANFQTLFSPQTVRSFCDKFRQALTLFQPVSFALNQPSREYQRERRFPFLNDEFHASGSFGEVWKFDIHPDFLSTEIKQTEWYRDHGKVSVHRGLFSTVYSLTSHEDQIRQEDIEVRTEKRFQWGFVRVAA